MVNLFPFVSCLMMLPGGPAIRAYECDALPESSGWVRELGDTPGADRSIVAGWFIQVVRLPDGWPEPYGEADFYRMSLVPFTNAKSFFLEWRAITDNPSWLLDLSSVPAALSAAGGWAIYHTTFTADKIQLFRGTSVPLEFVDILPNVPHTYRIELFGNEFFGWFVDGALVEYGIPSFLYPDPTAFLVWGSNRRYVDSVTSWDFVRFGFMPQPSSGDYDSDAAVTLIDLYFVTDCLTKDGPGIFGGPQLEVDSVGAGPGCQFANFNPEADSDVDLVDFAQFQNLFGATHP